MDKMESLRTGIDEMRSVARKLNQWADDLEASFRASQTDAAEVQASEPVSAPPLTLPEVRSVLAEKCAEGFGPQVKALIESYGASSLKEVPTDKYEELLSSVAGLGDGSCSGGDADAG